MNLKKVTKMKIFNQEFLKDLENLKSFDIDGLNNLLSKYCESEEEEMLALDIINLLLSKNESKNN